MVVSAKKNDQIYESCVVIVFGDVDGDGWYNGMDAFIVSLISAGLLTEENLGTAAWMAADCNHDGSIDEADFRLLEQAGLLLAEVDQLASHEELIQTNSVYVEYLALIDDLKVYNTDSKHPVRIIASVFLICVALTAVGIIIINKIRT